MKNTVIVENKNGKKKEFRVLLKFDCDKNKRYFVFTDDKTLNDGSLHTIVAAVNSKNKVLKSKPTIEEMKYIEKFLINLSKEM